MPGNEAKVDSGAWGEVHYFDNYMSNNGANVEYYEAFFRNAPEGAILGEKTPRFVA